MKKFIIANSFPKGKPPKRRAVEAREAREENDSMCMQIIDLGRIRSVFPPEATPGDDIPFLLTLLITPKRKKKIQVYL